MKVLLLAYDCNPAWSSLPGVGYKYAKALAGVVDAHLVTQTLNRENIEKVRGDLFTVDYMDVDYISRPLSRLSRAIRGGNELGWTTEIAMNYPTYLAFERQVWKKYAERLKRGEFALIHRITPMSQTLPSPLAGLSPVPFIVGPLNGGLDWPPQFRGMGAREREWMKKFRSVYKYMPYQKAMMRHAAAILASFQHTIADIGPKYADKTIDFPEVGFDPALFVPSARPVNVRKKIVFASRIVPLKMPDVAVEAVAGSEILRAHDLIMIGDGPERAKLAAMVQSRGLTNITFPGWMGQKDLGHVLGTSDIFVFPSIKDLGAGALVEGMAGGLAPVATDYGAASTLVAPERGVKVALGDHAQLVLGFRRALEDLVSDPERMTALGLAAQKYMLARFPWTCKAEKTKEIYSWVLGGRQGPKPSFW